ncbi:hypothetical protein C8R44DRAFT_867143 [Mycena epipterygia]|nr:hypothetical protein C8R44DRAFT_867143 [Mycena epipterygia]
MPHNGPPCQPPVFDHGFDCQEHDAQANSFYWTVFIGRVPGIYLDLDEAQAQTHKCSNIKWRRFGTYDEARTFWDE